MGFIIAFTITGAGIVTGILFAFSNFVLSSLSELSPSEGMRAMQKINEKIINPVFLIFFLATPVFASIVVIQSLSMANVNEMTSLLGALAYLFGPFGITVIKNVPLNNQLAQCTPEQAATEWPLYQGKWQYWNHIRSYMGIAAILLLSIASAAL